MSITLKYHIKPQGHEFKANYTFEHFEKLKKLTGTVGKVITIHVYDLQHLKGAYLATDDPFYLEVHDLVKEMSEITIVGEW